jgi:hypothetical protein
MSHSSLKSNRYEPLILVLYVDDLILTGAEKFIAGSKSDLAS